LWFFVLAHPLTIFTPPEEILMCANGVLPIALTGCCGIKVIPTILVFIPAFIIGLVSTVIGFVLTIIFSPFIRDIFFPPLVTFGIIDCLFGGCVFFWDSF